MGLDRFEVVNEIREQIGIPLALIRKPEDRSYQPLTSADVISFIKYFKRIKRTFNVLSWSKFYDCNRFSRLAVCVAELMHYASAKKGKTTAEAPAIAQVVISRPEGASQTKHNPHDVRQMGVFRAADLRNLSTSTRRTPD